MIGAEKINKQRQCLYCDVGRHTIKQGEIFMILPNGAMSCPDHKDAPLPESMLAGALS